MEFDSFSIADLHHHISSPTCEDLGIPRDLGRGGDLSSRGGLDAAPSPLGRMFRSAPGGGVIGAIGAPGQSGEGPNYDGHNVLNVDGLKYEMDNPNNPFSPFCQIPVPNPYASYECGFEPAFIRKRNERERERVRGVNDGYQRLRSHLPILENKEKRISKVETLRSAIKYIRHLKALLNEIDRNQTTPTPEVAASAKRAGSSENRQPEIGKDGSSTKHHLAKSHKGLLSEHKTKRKALDRDD